MNTNMIVYISVGVAIAIFGMLYCYNINKALHRCTVELLQKGSDLDLTEHERDVFMKDNLEFNDKISELELSIKKKDEKLSLVFAYLKMFENGERKVDSDTIKFALDMIKSDH